MNARINGVARRRLLKGAAGAALTGLATPALAQRAKTLRLGSPQPVDSNYHLAAVMFAAEVAKLSSNRLKVDVFPNAQLGSIKEMLNAVQLGTLSMTLAVPAWYSGIIKPMDVFTLPFLVRSPDRLRTALDGPLGDAVKAKAEAVNLRFMNWWLMGARHMVNNVRPINTPDDVVGLKMRVISSPVYIEAFRALGANPIVLDSAEIYLGVQQKVVDGLEYPVPDMINAKLYEVSKFMSLTAHTTDFFVVSMNKPLWDGMGTEEQGILTQAMKTATDWEWQAQPVTTTEALTKLGTLMKINDVTAANRAAFAQKTQTIYGKFQDSIGKDVMDLAMQNLNAA
jgi:tripartite ATP-independent transporter DctP family solute receptor